MVDFNRRTHVIGNQPIAYRRLRYQLRQPHLAANTDRLAAATDPLDDPRTGSAFPQVMMALSFSIRLIV